MTDLFKPFAEFFLTEKSLLKRIMAFIFISTVVLLVDNAIGFTYYQNISSKLTQVKTINQLLQSSHDSILTVRLLSLRQQLLEHEPWTSSILQNELNQNTAAISSKKDIRLMLLSSSWLYILLFLAAPFVGFIYKYDNRSILKSLGAILLFMLFIAIVGFLQYLLFNLIPVLFGQPVLNYILNFILSFAITTVLFKLNTLSPNRQSSE